MYTVSVAVMVGIFLIASLASGAFSLIIQLLLSIFGVGIVLWAQYEEQKQKKIRSALRARQFERQQQWDKEYISRSRLNRKSQN